MTEVDEHVTEDIDTSSPDRFTRLDGMLVRLANKLACEEPAAFTPTEVAAAYLQASVNILMNGLTQKEAFAMLRAQVAHLEATTAMPEGKAN